MTTKLQSCSAATYRPEPTRGASASSIGSPNPARIGVFGQLTIAAAGVDWNHLRREEARRFQWSPVPRVERVANPAESGGSPPWAPATPRGRLPARGAGRALPSLPSAPAASLACRWRCRVRAAIGFVAGGQRTGSPGDCFGVMEVRGEDVPTPRSSVRALPDAAPQPSAGRRRGCRAAREIVRGPEEAMGAGVCQERHAGPGSKNPGPAGGASRTRPRPMIWQTARRFDHQMLPIGSGTKG
jgi:hypothetical protein